MMRARLISALERFRRREDGASLVEFTVVVILFLLVFFALLDFGRLGFNWVMTEKAMQRAVRIAAVRPPVCTGVPETIAFNTSSSGNPGSLCRASSAPCVAPATTVKSCVLAAADAFTPVTGDDPCATPVSIPSGGSTTPAEIATALRLQTAQEIWCVLEPILPSNAAPNNIRMTYRHDPNLGFAGGPYVPIVEVGVVTQSDVGTAIDGDEEELCFEFITPIPGLAAMAGGAVIDMRDSDEVTANVCDEYSLPAIPFPDLSVSMPGEDLNQGTNG